MIRHRTAAAVALLSLGLTLVITESLSLRKSTSRSPHGNALFPTRKKLSECSPFRSERSSSSRLFSLSDFSSHPYSVYYGTSGSTARQNFDQNDNINDVYGYGPDDRGHDEPYERPENRRLRSMQDDARLSGRRGATVFGRKYGGGRQGLAYSKDEFYVDHSRHEFFHDEDPYMEDPHIEDRHMEDRRMEDPLMEDPLMEDPRMEDPRMEDPRMEDPRMEDPRMEDPRLMDQFDNLLYERDNLRRNLNAVIRENIHLQNHPSSEGGPESRHRIADEMYQDTYSMPQAQTMQMGRDQLRNGVVDDVMAELRTMQRTLLTLQNRRVEQEPENEVQEQNLNLINPAPDERTDASRIVSVMDSLKNMQQTLESFGVESEQTTPLNDDLPAYDASKSETSQPETHDPDANSPPKMEHRHNFEVNLKNPMQERISSRVGCIGADDAARVLSGEYVVVINAELKLKSEMDGTDNRDQQKTTGGDDGPGGGSSPFRGESFGTKYL